MSPALSVTVASVEVVAVTVLAGAVELLVEPVAAVVDVAPEVSGEVLVPVLVVLAGVELVVTGVAAGKVLCVWLELLFAELSAACAGIAIVVNSNPEQAIASTRAATDRKLINMFSPWNSFELLFRTASQTSVRAYGLRDERWLRLKILELPLLNTNLSWNLQRP